MKDKDDKCEMEKDIAKEAVLNTTVIDYVSNVI